MQENRDSELYFNATKPDMLAVSLAIILTLLIHAFLYWAIPAKFETFTVNKKVEELKLEILPPKINRATPEFVEANPYANQLTPNANAPESFQNQRAADEIPDPTSKSKMPLVKGESKDSKKIVSGTSAERDAMSPENVMEVLKRPLEQQSMTGSGERTKTEVKEREASAEKSQAQADEKEKSKDDNDEKIDGAKTSITQADKSPDQTKDSIHAEQKTSDKTSDGKKEAEKPAQMKKSDIDQKKSPKPQEKKIEQQKSEEKKSEPQQQELPKPQKRPMLSMKIPAGPLADNNRRASMLGTLAVDSRFSEFGAYMQRMIEAVSRQWNLLASSYDLMSAVGTVVVVEYHINPHGDLVKLNVNFSNSTKTGSALCEQCILTTAPYGEWTQEMIDSLGNQDQSVTITFHYR